MEIIELAEKRKAFIRSSNRYLNPHKEAIKLRLLWTYDKPPSKSRDLQEVRNHYQEILKYVETDDLSDVHQKITKGLMLDPKFHAFYALRGDLYKRAENWAEAIKSYESARKMTKFDHKLTDAQAKIMYNRQLMEVYTARGKWYHDKGLLLEAVSDYEQVLVLKLHGMSTNDVQDNLLQILRELEKYEAFRFHWNTFIKTAEGKRSSVLLRFHAEYKIHLREMSTARYMLLEALNLDEDNIETRELLQVVYSTGHTMAAYSVLWCMHGCYDKALITIEKARECDPYNPGFTLLKTIILRLSGRYEEALSWLETVDKGFHKLVQPSRDKRSSIMGKFSMVETRNELIKQWYLIRYDMAMKCMTNNQHEKASRIVHGSNLTQYYTEPCILIGDGLLKNEKTDLALEMYLRCRDRRRELCLPISRKTIDLAERIIDILIDRAQMAVQERRSNVAIAITDKILQILDEDEIEIHQLSLQRGRALLQNARALFQLSIKKKIKSKESCQRAADSLKFVRDEDESDLYRFLYGSMEIEKAIDRFASMKKLPRSLKILMQHS